MSEYMNAAAHGKVCKDGSELLDSATECNRLAEENRRLRTQCQQIGYKFARLSLIVTEIDNYISGKRGG